MDSLTRGMKHREKGTGFPAPFLFKSLSESLIVLGAFAFLSQRPILFSSESAPDASCFSGATLTPIHHLKRFPALQRLRNMNIRKKLDAQKKHP